MSTLYDSTLPVFVHGLGALRAWLATAERHAAETGLAPKAMLEARLAPDMFNLTQQVGYAYFTSLEAAQHLSGRAQPEMGYDETTVGELYTSIDRVLDHLRSIAPGDVDESGAGEVETFLLPDRKMRIDRYVRYFALPNFYFHLTAGYCILRHLGVPLGKADYIGQPPSAE